VGIIVEIRRGYKDEIRRDYNRGSGDQEIGIGGDEDHGTRSTRRHGGTGWKFQCRRRPAAGRRAG
jgi:hypothetical protein